jgi:general secretion pathway protein B
MSYILDALRRAEAERDRGQVPGLHTQPVPPPAMPTAPARLRPALLWAGASVALLLLAALLWLLLPRPAAHEPVVLADAPQVPSAPVAALPPPPPAPVVIAPAEAMKVVPVAPLLPPRGALFSAPTSSPASVPANTATSDASPAPAPAPASAIVLWDRLPESQRRQMPALALGGAIWSESAANRMLIVGGQLLHEGDTAAPGVTVEQIRPKSAVLRWKDLRYEVSF